MRSPLCPERPAQSPVLSERTSTTVRGSGNNGSAHACAIFVACSKLSLLSSFSPLCLSSGSITQCSLQHPRETQVNSVQVRIHCHHHSLSHHQFIVILEHLLSRVYVWISSSSLFDTNLFCLERRLALCLRGHIVPAGSIEAYPPATFSNRPTEYSIVLFWYIINFFDIIRRKQADYLLIVCFEIFC